MTGLPLHDAARALGIRPGTLRRWIRQGCPAQRGRRGRGNSTLVNPESVRQWREADPVGVAILEIADALPETLAGAIAQSHRLAQGIDKRQLAGILAATWVMVTTAALDHLRDLNPYVPEIETLPDEIERLRKINRE